MNYPIISIIIPSFNYGHLITDTLMCLKNQQFESWEAIIVDDGSEDDTRAVVDRFVKEDPRFIYLHQVNSGVSKARNYGLKQARGKYIQFLDADDLVSSAKIQIQVDFLESNPGIDLVTVDTRYFHTDRPDKLFTDLNLANTSFRKPISGQGFPVVLKLIHNNPIVILNPVFKRKVLEIIHGFDEQMDYLEDWDLWFRCALNNFRFEYLDAPEACALVRSHSISASKQDTKILEGEGYFRRRIKDAIKKTSNLTIKEKNVALETNKAELIITYKYLMGNIELSNLIKFAAFYRQMRNPLLFSICFLKSLNIRRKLKRSNLPN